MAERARGKDKKASKPKGSKKMKGAVATLPRKGKGKGPGVGHNSGAVSPSPALIKSHHDKLDGIEERMAAAKAKLDQVKGEHRSAYSVVKKDGIDVEAFKLARKLHGEDHGVVVQTYSKVGDYLSAIKSPLATQLDLFGNVEVPEEMDAASAGAQAFRNSEDRANNPHKVGSAAYAAWDGAWMAEAAKVDVTAPVN